MVFTTRAGTQSAASAATGVLGSSILSGLNAVQAAQQQASALRAAQLAASAGAVLGASQSYNQHVNQTINNSTTIIDQVSDGVLSFLGHQVANIANSVNGQSSVFSNLISRVESNIENALSFQVDNLRNSITSPINNLVVGLNGNISRGFDIFSNEVNGLKSFVGQGINKALAIVGGVINKASGLALSGLKSVQSFGNAIKDNVIGYVGQVGNRVLTTIGDGVGLISNKAESIKNDLVGSVDRLYGKSVGFLDKKIQDIKSGVSRTVEKIRGDFITFKSDLFNRAGDIFDTAKVFLSDRLDEFLQVLAQIFDRVIQTVMVGIRASGENLIPLFNQLTSIFEKVVTNRYASFNEVQDDLEKAGASSGPLGFALIGLVSVIGLAPVLFGISQPFAQNLNTLAMEMARPSLLTPEEAAVSFYRGLLNQDEYSTELRKAGYSDERIQAVKESNRPLLGPRDIQFNFLRGNITLQQHDMMLAEHGFTDERIQLIKELYFVIPGIQDLITMSVREVFTPEIAEEFGQFDDFPNEIVQWGEKQGISREWLERYWAAHWGLPSPRQGFEMLHRRIIDEDKLKLLLRALDVMPGWRDELVQLSYNPVTRVDVRRIYRLGIFDLADVKDAYLDLGYSPEKADIMTEFTRQYEGAKPSKEIVKLRNTVIDITSENYFQQRISYDFAKQALSSLGMQDDEINALLSIEDLKRQQALKGDGRVSNALKVRKMVLKAYQSRAMSRLACETALGNIGMEPLQISLDLDDIDLEVERGVKQAIATRVQDLYSGMTITKTEVHTILGASGFVSDEIDHILQQLDSVRELGTRKPTRADLDKFLANEIISITEYERELEGLGYYKTYVNWFVRLKRLDGDN